jgi:hypothetical protein
MLGPHIRYHKISAELSLCFIKHHAKKTYGGIQVQLHAFSALALDGDECQVYAPAALFRRNSPYTHWQGHRFGPRKLLEKEKSLYGI